MQSLSGVNLDEEAANLVRYQQAYMAAAQMIRVADTMFQAVLQARPRITQARAIPADSVLIARSQQPIKTAKPPCVFPPSLITATRSEHARSAVGAVEGAEPGRDRQARQHACRRSDRGDTYHGARAQQARIRTVRQEQFARTQST